MDWGLVFGGSPACIHAGLSGWISNARWPPSLALLLVVYAGVLQVCFEVFLLLFELLLQRRDLGLEFFVRGFLVVQLLHEPGGVFAVAVYRLQVPADAGLLGGDCCVLAC